MKRIPELDGLRGIAILLVIGCHYQVFARQFGSLPKFGWIGVDLFFVLSGFLITSVLLNLLGQGSAFRKFYARRIRRIIPPYAAFLVLLYIVVALFGQHALYSKTAIIKNVFFLQSFENPADLVRRLTVAPLAHADLPTAKPGLWGSVSNSVGVLWSLSIEEYYYLLWAPVILWLGRRRAVVVGIVICVAALAARWLAWDGWTSYFHIYYRFDAPVFGSLAALLLTSKLSRRTVNAILISAGVVGAGVLAAVLAPLGNILDREIRADHSFMVFGLPALSLIAASAVGISAMRSGSRFLFPLRWMGLRFFGKISYMLYLLHGFVYLTFINLFGPTWTASLAALACAVLLSWISWTYYEEPILQGGRESSGKPQSNATDLPAGASQSGAIGLSATSS